MIDPQYRTGNKKMDQKIKEAFEKDSNFRPVRVERISIEKNYKSPFTHSGKFNISPVSERTWKDGTIFASKKEMFRWDELVKMQESGMIKDLKRQVPFELLEGFIHRQWGEIQPMTYVADATYTDISYRKGYEGRACVEDVKGMLTKEYKLKKKLFFYKYGLLAFFEI